MAMGRITLHPALGSEVVRRLRELAPLPATGIVAGQAVASVIDRMQGMSLAPVNDIDIFRRAPNTALKRKTQSATGTVTLRRTAMASPGQVLEYDALASVMEALRSYRVSSVSRQGLLNFVNCALPEVSLIPTLSAGRVLEAFDLNCVRVAVDLATERLYWDGHYARFLRHRRIEIAAVHTPWHTFLRALKKAHELPDTTLDLEALAMAVTAFSQSDIHEALSGHNATTSHFGPMLFERAQAYRSYWSRYFDMQPRVCRSVHAGEDVTVYALKPRAYVEPSLVRRIDALNYGALHFTGPLVHGLFAPSAAASRTAARMNEVETMLNPGDELRVGALVQTNPFVVTQGHLSERHVDTVSEFLMRHGTFRSRFAALTLDEQFEAAKCLKRLHRNASAVGWDDFCSRVTPTHLVSPSATQAFFEELMQARRARLFAKPVKLPEANTFAPLHAGYVVQVRELASLEDIEQAGRLGYPDKHTDPFLVKKGRLFIFEILVREPASRSPSVSWVVCDGRYHRCWKANRYCGPAAKDAVHALVREGLLKALIPKAAYRLMPQDAAPTGSAPAEDPDDIPF